MEHITIQKNRDPAEFRKMQDALIKEQITALNNIIEILESDRQTVQKFIDNNDPEGIIGRDYSDEWARGSPYFKQHTLKNLSSKLKNVADDIAIDLKRLRYHNVR